MVFGLRDLIRRLVLGPLKTNTYIVVDDGSGSCLVVDPAEDSNRLVDEVRKLCREVVAIVATHGHFDHVMGVKRLATEFKVPFLIHRLDLEVMKLTMEWIGAEAPIPSGYLEDGQRIKVGGIELVVMHTPGHSPGSVCLYIPKMKTVLTGDTLFRGAVGRTDLPGGDEIQLAESIRRLYRELPLDTRVLPGHGSETSLNREAASNPFVRMILGIP